MNRDTTRVRAALENKPELLIDLFQDFWDSPPRVLLPWAPFTTPPTDKRPLTITRRNLFHHAVIMIQPYRGGGIKGPWKIATKKIDGTPEEQAIDELDGTLRDSSHNWTAATILEAIDSILEAHHYTLGQHNFPDVGFGPWRPSGGKSPNGRFSRHIKRLDKGMDSNFEVVIETRQTSKGIDYFHGSIYFDPDTAFTTSSHNLLGVQQRIDRELISLGYNLARPSSFSVSHKKNKDETT